MSIDQFDTLIVAVLKDSQSQILNAGVISACVDCKMTHHHQLIKKCFERGAVDIMYMGDLEDVEIKLGLREKRETKEEPTLMQKLAEPYRDELKEMFPDLTEKVGRNDPCPCGSGKKYKKCCLKK